MRSELRGELTFWELLQAEVDERRDIQASCIAIA